MEEGTYEEESDAMENITICPGYDHAEAVKQLFSEYTAMLVEQDAGVKACLEAQGYDGEIEDLRGKYGLPCGRLYLACFQGLPVATAALRKIDAKTCEAKRLFVRPSFRGKGIGRLLMDQILRDARNIGYERMVLDTLPFLEAAISLYKQYGFAEIGPYYDNPLPAAIYMGLDL